MARSRGRRKRSESLVEMLLESPWQVSVIFGVVVFIGLKWILPAIAASNMFLKPVAAGFAQMAWLFSGVFFLIAAVVFAIQQARRPKEPAEIPDVGRNRRAEARPAPYRINQSVRGSSGQLTPGAGFVPESLDAAVQATTTMNGDATKPKPSAWTIELLRELEWKRFEDLCQKFYEKKGIRSETTPLGPDGGIDVRLYQDDSGRATSVVQCKAWGDRFVGVKPVRELLGVMTHEKIGKAFFMTSGFYSDEAKALAKANRITLIDGDMLLMMILRLPAEVKESLLAFAVEGDYAAPTCPSCGIKMKRVQGKEGRPAFWGCHNYPRCRQKLGMRRA